MLAKIVGAMVVGSLLTIGVLWIIVLKTWPRN